MGPLTTTRLRRCLAAAAVLAVAACGRAPAPAPSPPPPSILMVVWDTVGAAHVGSLGEDAGPTPNLDALAAEGVLFRHAFTTAPWTQPAVASILTGLYPSHHGVLRLYDILAAANKTIAERLAGAGYRTAGFVSHELLAARLGVAQGFASWDESAIAGHEGISSPAVTQLAASWLAARDDQPFFLLAHYFDPHMLYLHHPEFDLTTGYDGPLTAGMGVWEMRDARPTMSADDIAFLRDLHREEVAFTDAALGRLLAALEATGRADDTIVIVVADHGEEIMERGWIGHARTLYDELIHVPLVMRVPHGPRGLVVDTPVSLVDLAPTLAEFAGTTFADGAVDGRSLVPLLRGGEAGALADRNLFAEVSFTLGPDDGRRHTEKVAFKTALLAGPRALIHDLMRDSWELYRRDEDPLEKRDLVTSDPATSELGRQLAAWEANRDGAASPVHRVLPQPDELERLRALGYVQ